MTRHDLKDQLQHDQFTDRISSAVNYTVSHRETVIRWIVIAVVVLLLAGAIVWYNAYRRSLREQDLRAALDVVEAPVAKGDTGAKSFGTQKEKDAASLKALSDVVTKDGGSSEGYLAQYYRGTLKAGANDFKGAETDLRAVAGSGTETAALAQVALSQLYIGTGRTAEARQILQSLINKPAHLVSKPQAELMMAQLDLQTNPKDAKKRLDLLRSPTQRPVITRAVDQLTSQLNSSK